jgi:hypothetical protein
MPSTRKLLRKLDGFFVVALAVLVLSGFQYWAVKAKEREWWWFNRGADHMAFADLHSKSSGSGHLLVVERKPQQWPAVEHKIEWQCSSQQIRWGDGWSVADDLQQQDRVGVPISWRAFHPAANPMERDFLFVACNSAPKQFPIFKLEKVSPFVLARKAFDYVARGEPRYRALIRAANDQ